MNILKIKYYKTNISFWCMIQAIKHNESIPHYLDIFPKNVLVNNNLFEALTFLEVNRAMSPSAKTKFSKIT
ncbi:hypothetical protein BpHYR1_006152 [Brachionus plicatilis]|uniref:Uncharacterized protein n=1 Tax=Brachionus plicatilis TaxID=10195 RepID=A0A3M7RA94_BRAPC|nr:hypothetical protein BpHYR1_006152 [Brachionus plicatilis]